MNIRRAVSQSDLQAVWRLTYREYLKRGWCESNTREELRHHPELDEIDETIVLLAEDDGGALRGTVSVTRDGPRGLSVDAAFPVMTAATRDAAACAGWRLAAAWRMVVRPNERLCVCRALIDAHLGDMTARELDATVYEMHPRHVRFYKRCLGLRKIDRIKNNPTVGGAPAVLMLGRLDAMLETWKRRRGSDNDRR